MLNNYITEIDTKIIKRKYVKGKTHVVPKDNIILNYSDYSIEREDIFINNNKVEDIYNSSIGFVLVANFKPKTDDINIKINYNNRLKLLKSLTARLLIQSVLLKYYGLEALNFYTSIEISSFEINGIYFDNEIADILKTIETNINEYIKYALDVIHNKEKNSTSIDGLYHTHYFPCTTSNISEIYKFKIDSYSFNNNGVKIFYATS